MRKILLLLLMLLICGSLAYANNAAIAVSAEGTTISAGDTIRRLPIISALMIDNSGIDTTSIGLNVDGVLVGFTKTIEVVSSVECIVSIKITTPLDKGTHNINASVRDISGNLSTKTVTPVIVFGTVSLSGVAKNYPNPFKPLQGQKTKLAYSLTEDGNISILIYDIAGNPVKKLLAAAGGEASPGIGLGGRQGYNEVEWDGISAFGSVVGNGVFPYLLISEGKIIGTGQAAVYD